MFSLMLSMLRVLIMAGAVTIQGGDGTKLLEIISSESLVHVKNFYFGIECGPCSVI